MEPDLNDSGTQWSPAELLKYPAVIWRAKWLLVIGAILGASWSLWNHINAVPVYTATSQILIERPHRSANAFDQLLERQSGWGRVDPTQLQLLESRDFILRVLRKQDELLGRSEPAAQAAQRSVARTRSFRVRVLEVGESVVDYLREKVQGPPPQHLDAELLPEDLRDRRVSARVSGFRATMRVRPVAATNLVNIQWTSGDPVLAARMATLIAEEFVDYTVETQALLAEQAGTFLTEEIASLRSEIRAAEDEARELAAQMGLDESLVDDTNNSASLRELESQHATARADRVQKEAALRQMQAASPSSVAEVRSAEAVRRARGDLTDLRDELDTESERLTNAHPRIVELRQDVADAQERLRTEESAAYDLAVATANQAYRAALRYESRIQGMLDTQRGEAARLGEDFVRYSDLRALAANKRDVMQQFLDQQESMELSSRVRDFQGATVRVVDRATLPRAPSGRQLPSRMMFAALLGALVGALAAVALDFADSTMRSAVDVARRLGTEPLATLMSLDAAKRMNAKLYGYSNKGYGGEAAGDGRPEFIMLEQPRTLLAEEYRELRTNLLLSTAGAAPRRVLVTSSDPSEGKTSISVNLATSLAQTGKRVLLVDGDMRRPRLRDLFEIESDEGLSNYLAGAVEWKNTVRDTSIENLWVITSGPVPPNPSELYSGNRDEAFFEDALDHFDMVVVDAPPVMNVVDPLILAREVDGVLLVVRAGTTPHHAVAKTRARLQDVGGRVLGLVLSNATPADSRGRYGARYYRRYERRETPAS